MTEPEPVAPPSPFLEGTHIQYAWDSTSLGLFKACPRKYQYTMILGYTPKSESCHLLFGRIFHAALEAYDHAKVEGFDHNDCVHEAVRYAVEESWFYPTEPSPEEWTGYPLLPNLNDKDTRYKNRETLISLIVDYLDYYGADDTATTITLANGRPAVELSFRFELDFGPGEAGAEGQPYLLCGHLDRLVDFNDGVYVMDRKTTKTTLSEYYFNQYEPDNQMTLYTYAGQILFGSPIKGVIVDGCQIKLEEPNAFARGFTSRTEGQLNEWMVDLQATLMMAEYYATSAYWPMNDTACDKYGGCKFRGICSKDPEVREIFLKSDFDKLELSERWNPLKPR